MEISTGEFKKGTDAGDLLAMVPRALGAIVVNATAWAARDDVNYRSLAKIFIEEFKFGAKEAADQLTEHREADGK